MEGKGSVASAAQLRGKVREEEKRGRGSMACGECTYTQRLSASIGRAAGQSAISAVVPTEVSHRRGAPVAASFAATFAQ